MVGTNVNITKKAQELLIKAAAERKVSVETLASEILNECDRAFVAFVGWAKIQKTQNVSARAMLPTKNHSPTCSDILFKASFSSHQSSDRIF